MAGESITVRVLGEERAYPKGTEYLVIAEDFQKKYRDDIILAYVDNRLCELHKKAGKDEEVTFVTTADRVGRKAYRRSVTLLMQKALYGLLGKGKSEVRVL